MSIPRPTILQSSALLTLALFLGRVLGETMLAPLLTLGLTAVLGVSFVLLNQRLQLRLGDIWPLWLLGGYVLWPTPRLDIAAFILLVTLTTAVLNVLKFNRDRKTELSNLTFCSSAVQNLILSSGAFLLYLLTLAPSLLPADNGEFQLVGATLGLAHPPGFPLYTLLAHLSTWLPLPLTAGGKINLLSAFLASLTLGVVGLTASHLPREKNRYTAVGALLAITALATSTTFWAQATQANIRIPTALLATLAFYTLLRFENATHQQDTPTADRWLTFFALTMSLGLTHHLSLAFMALIMGGFVIWVDARFFITPRRWTRPLLATLIGPLPLLYLPLADPTLRDPAEFLTYALGLGFQGDFFYFHTPAQLWQRAGVMLNIFTFQFNPLLLLGALVGFGLLLRSAPQRPRAFLLGGTLLIHTLIVATYRAPQAVEYMLPAYVPLVLLMASGTADLLQKTEASRYAPLATLYAALLLTAGITQGVSHWPSYRALHHNQDTAVYTDTILNHAPPNSVVLANWHWVTPLWYEQTVNGRRPDLDIIYLYPQTADYSQEWATRIQQELAHGRAVVTTFYNENSYRSLPPAQPLGEAYLFPNAPLTRLPDGFTPLEDITLSDEIRLHGYQLSTPTTEIGQEATLTVAWEPLPDSIETGLSPALFAHLVRFDGSLVAQHDLTAVAQPAGLTLTQFRLTPRYEAAPGDHALFVGYAPAGGDPERTQLATLTVTPMRFPPATHNPTHQRANGRTLIGYDWDNTISTQPRLYLHWQLDTGGYWSEAIHPANNQHTVENLAGAWGWTRPRTFTNPQNTFYVPLGQGMVWFGARPWLSTLSPLQPGQPVTIHQSFQATRPVLRDIGFSVRLLGFAEDNFTWLWRTPDTADSDIPAMGGIPTLKWIAGSEVNHPRTLTIDPSATPGQTVGGLVRPYDVFTNQPLPLLDGRLATSPQPWLPLVPGTVE